MEAMNQQTVNALKILVRAYYDYQDERLALDGRLGVKKDLTIKKGVPERDDAMLAMLLKRRRDILQCESDLEKEIGKKVKTHPMWKAFFDNVSGCGPCLAAVILTEIDIHKATTVSKIWQFAGLNPGMVSGKKWKKKKDGTRELVVANEQVRGDKKTEGYVCPYNQFLRAKLCGVLGGSFLKCGSEYRKYYDNMRHRLESMNWGTPSKNPGDKDNPRAGHQHKAAIRYMVKMFIRDLYIAWRTVEGLEVRPPYQEQYLKHKHDAA
jgi:hypothetical protein